MEKQSGSPHAESPPPAAIPPVRTLVKHRSYNRCRGPQDPPHADGAKRPPGPAFLPLGPRLHHAGGDHEPDGGDPATGGAAHDDQEDAGECSQCRTQPQRSTPDDTATPTPTAGHQTRHCTARWQAAHHITPQHTTPEMTPHHTTPHLNTPHQR